LIVVTKGSVHLLTAEKDAFPLIAGGLVRRPHEISRFFPPKQIAKSLNARDAYVQSYLGMGGWAFTISQ
jgi:hypothetical protein